MGGLDKITHAPVSASVQVGKGGSPAHVSGSVLSCPGVQFDLHPSEFIHW